MLGTCTVDADETDGKPPLLVLEYLAGGSLEDWLPTNGPALSGSELRAILHQVALGLSGLGRLGIVHRDLAARNILIDADLSVKISDFGLSRGSGVGTDATTGFSRTVNRFRSAGLHPK